MKKFLMAAAATAALAIAAPAFAQTTAATPQATTPPAASAQPMDSAQPSAQPASPQAQTSTPTPDAAAAPMAQPAPSATADTMPAQPTASVTAQNETTTRTRHSSRRGNASTFGSSSNVALNTQVPAPVSEVVQRGHYTAEDLNRAQLQALQTGSTTSPG